MDQDRQEDNTCNVDSNTSEDEDQHHNPSSHSETQKVSLTTLVKSIREKTKDDEALASRVREVFLHQVTLLTSQTQEWFTTKMNPVLKEL